MLVSGSVMNIAKHSHFFTTNIQSCVKTWTQHSEESESRENALQGIHPPTFNITASLKFNPARGSTSKHHFFKDDMLNFRVYSPEKFQPVAWLEDYLHFEIVHLLKRNMLNFRGFKHILKLFAPLATKVMCSHWRLQRCRGLVWFKWDWRRSVGLW